MLIKILWTLIACITFTMGIMSLVMMFLYMANDETAYALVALCGGMFGMGFSIHLTEKEVLTDG